MKKDLCDPTLPFVKTVGPKVFWGEILVVLVSKITVAIWAWAFCSLNDLFPQILLLVSTRVKGLM